VCDYERQKFDTQIGIAGKPFRVVHNGVWADEFSTPAPLPDATDFLFIGEMRDFKGVDILLRALATFDKATLTLVGDGPQLEEYKNLSQTLGIAQRARFVGRKTMAQAAQMGRIMVLPSRFESFPYVVLETAAAGLPLITSNVGGIPEVLPRHMLCDPLTPDELSKRMAKLLEDPKLLKSEAASYSALIREKCCAADMCKKITDFYSVA
jgi:glycosyltransferase involved in cell wall biosynthesis